jgi:hypothetical protein
MNKLDTSSSNKENNNKTKGFAKGNEIIANNEELLLAIQFRIEKKKILMEATV